MLVRLECTLILLRPIDVARKWVSGGTYSLLIRGNVAKNNVAGGSGVIARIYKNASSLYSQTVAGTDGIGYNYRLETSVVNGDSIYFRLNNNGDYTSDGTNFDPTIMVRVYTSSEPTHTAPSTEASAYNTSGSFTTTAQSPAGVYNWGILTYTKTTPGTSTATVDVLNGSNDAVIVSNVASGTNLNLAGLSLHLAKN